MFSFKIFVCNRLSDAECYCEERLRMWPTVAVFTVTARCLVETEVAALVTGE